MKGEIGIRDFQRKEESSIDAGQPEQNWNNGKIKGYDLGVST